MIIDGVAMIVTGVVCRNYSFWPFGEYTRYKVGDTSPTGWKIIKISARDERYNKDIILHGSDGFRYLIPSLDVRGIEYVDTSS